MFAVLKTGGKQYKVQSGMSSGSRNWLRTLAKLSSSTIF